MPRTRRHLWSLAKKVARRDPFTRAGKNTVGLRLEVP
jgi:hypothetical protein